jgi:hypothetical protein
MSEEEKGTPTDDALDEALKKDAENQTSTEEVPSETKTEEKFDAKEVMDKINNLSAEIGRGGKALNEIESVKNDIASLKSLLENQATTRQTEQETENIVTTESDVRNVFQRLQTEEQTKKTKYESDYLDEIARLANADKLDDKQMDELSEILKTSVTNSRSNFTNHAWDAETNYLKAMRILDKKGDKSVNLKGDDPKGTGIGKPSENGGSKDATMPKLDPVAQEYADKMKMTAEEVSNALKGL